jgi:transcriptional regulator with XRE-family HTH domain
LIARCPAQQVQKYEKGTNRVSASRLQHMCQILQVPVSFFFDGLPASSGVRNQDQLAIEASSPA